MEATLRWRRSCCHWPGVKLAEVLVEELVALEGVAAAHVTGAAVVGAGVANGWSCSSCRCDERIPLLLFLRMKAPRRGGFCLCCYCWGCGSRGGWNRSPGEREGVAVAAWWSCRLPMAELVFVVVFRPGVLVFSREKAAVEEVEWGRKKNREKVAETGKKLIFWLILHPLFSSLRTWNLILFIGVEEGNLVFTGKQIPALDSIGKDLNRWLKVGMVHCQFAAAGCLRWPLWSGSTSVYVPVSRLRPYPDVEGCLVIRFVHGLANFVDVKCLKCTYKGGDRTRFSGKKEEDNE